MEFVEAIIVYKGTAQSLLVSFFSFETSLFSSYFNFTVQSGSVLGSINIAVILSIMYGTHSQSWGVSLT